MKHFFLSCVLALFSVAMNAQDADYCTSTAVKSNDGRGWTSLKATTSLDALNIPNLGPNTSGSPCYRNFSDQVITAAQGSVMTLTFEHASSWMGSNIYLDANQDKTFATDESECLYAKDGEQTQAKVYSIKIPNDAMLGKTRLRFLSQWRTEEGPCGNDAALNDNNGIIIDISVDIVKPLLPASNTINVNFGSTVSGTALSGAVAVARDHWNNCTGGTGSAAALKIAKVDGSLEVGSASVTWAASGIWNYTAGVTDPILNNYLDESASKPTPTITIKDIPFPYYRVIVYRATDTDKAQFAPVSISNGTEDVKYTSTVSTITASTPGFTIKGDASFGVSRQPAPVKGANFLVSDRLTSGSDLVVKSTRTSGTARGCIAAIQIVEVTEDDTFDADELASASSAVTKVAQSKLDAIAAIPASEITETPKAGHYLASKLNAVKTSLQPYLDFTATTFSDVAPALAEVNAISPQVVKSTFEGVYLVKRPTTGIEPGRGTYLGETGDKASSKLAMDATTFWRVTTTAEDDAVIKMVNVKSGNQVNPLATSNAAFTLTSEDRLITLAPLDGTNWKDVTQYNLKHGGITFHRSNAVVSAGSTDMTIVNWTGVLNSASSWSLMPVKEAVDLAKQDAESAKLAVGDKIGCVPAADLALLNEAIAALDVASSDSDIINAIVALNEAIKLYKSKMVAPVVDSGTFFFFKGLRGPEGEAYAKSNGVGVAANVASYSSTEKNKYLFEFVTVDEKVALKSRELTEAGEPIYLSTDGTIKGISTAPAISISTIRESPYNRTADNRAMWILEGSGYRMHTGGSGNSYQLMNWTGNAADHSSWDLIEYAPEVTLLEVIRIAEAKLASYKEGTAIGNVSVESLTEFRSQIAAAKAIYDDFGSYSPEQIEAAELALDGQVSAFNPVQIQPKMDQWYAIQSMSTVSTVNGKFINLDAMDANKLHWKNFTEIDPSVSNMMWKFVADEAGFITMVNRSMKDGYVENKTSGSGAFSCAATKPEKSISFHLLGDDHLFILSNGQIHADTYGSVVCWDTELELGTSSSWKLIEVTPSDLETLATKIEEAEAAILVATGKPGVDVAIASTQSAIEAAQLIDVTAYEEDVTAAITALEGGIEAIEAGLLVGVDSASSIEKVYVESGVVKAAHADAIQVFTLTGVEIQNANLKSGVYIAKVAGKSIKVTVK